MPLRVWQAPREGAMTDQDQPDPAFDTFTSRLIRREALRRAALELSTATPAGLESTLAQISAEVTADAASAKVESAKKG
jgi:phage shock protein A